MSYTLGSLSASKTYYYRAFVAEYSEATGTYEYRYGEVKSFVTTDTEDPVTLSGWLELPSASGNADYTGTFYGTSGSKVGTNRNYSYTYSYDMVASMWVAYPLTSSHTSGSGSGSWKSNPNIPADKQISGSYSSAYNAGAYSRGHQIPNGDRKSGGMNAATYYYTNQTPQLQNKFNGSIWASLENSIRGILSGSDTVYVATGPVYKKKGGNETITYLTGDSGVVPAKVPVPNYYWKALLKVKWGTSGGKKVVTSASAVGFWFEHKNYDGTDYASYATSIDKIEEYTGLDLFANLPDDIEVTVEKNTNWTTFRNF